MIAIIACALLIALSVIGALVTASPLFRTMSIAIDQWADEVQGDAKPLR